MQIEAPIENVIKFIKNFKSVRWHTYQKLIPILEQTLIRDVFNYQTGNKTIRSKSDLRRLISAAKGTSQHIPGRAPQGPNYSAEYLRKKQKLGELRPHKYMNYGFWQGIEFYIFGGNIFMEANELESSNKSPWEDSEGNMVNYLEHHEKRRSVLKLTFLLSWQELIQAIIKSFAKSIKR